MSSSAPPVRTRAGRRPGSYAAVASVRLRAILQYRAAALAAVATQVFWGLLRLMILDGFYRSDPGPATSRPSTWSPTSGWGRRCSGCSR